MAMRYSYQEVRSKSTELKDFVEDLVDGSFLRQSTVDKNIREFSIKNPSISGTVILKGDGVKTKWILPIKE